jgi:hypothetical protein
MDRLDVDGLPCVGAAIWPGQSMYSTKDAVSGRYKAHKLKGEEVGHVEQARRDAGGWKGALELFL